MLSVHRSMRALGAFVLLLGFTAPVVAATSDTIVSARSLGTVTRTMQVEISDLHLGTAEGRRTLDHRVTFAAKKVCGYNNGYGLRHPEEYSRCLSKAKTEALAKAGLRQTAMN